MFKCLCLWLYSGGKLGSSLHQAWSSFTKVFGFLDFAIYWQPDRALTNSKVLVEVEDRFLSPEEVFSLYFSESQWSLGVGHYPQLQFKALVLILSASDMT